MDGSALPRAVAACNAVAAAYGLRAEDAKVLNNSNRLAVHLRPCDVLARVAPRTRQNGAQFEVEVARRLAETGAPLATLDPRVEPGVYEQDDFVVTLWTYHEPVPPHGIGADEYASALERLHAGMREVDLTGDWVPHFKDRVDEAQFLVDDPINNAEIAGADRELVGTTLSTMRRAIVDRGAPEQLLHGEPHPGNLLRTRGGMLFVDLETCCRGPIEFDIAHATTTASGPPVEVGALYAGADQSLVRDCWILMLAMVTAWRCEPGDDLPNRRALAMTGSASCAPPWGREAGDRTAGGRPTGPVGRSRPGRHTSWQAIPMSPGSLSRGTIARAAGGDGWAVRIIPA